MDKIEQKILNTIDAHREEIIKIGRDIWEHAECGYKEVRTSRLFQDHMKKLGLSVENAPIRINSLLPPDRKCVV